MELAEVPDLTHKNGTKKRSELRPFFTEASIVEDLEPELGVVMATIMLGILTYP